MNKQKLLYFIKNYRFQSLFIKNLLLIFVLTLVPFVGTGIVVYYQMNGIVQKEISSVNLNSLYRIRDVSDTIIKQTDLMATKLSLQTEVKLFVFTDNPEQILNKYYKELYKSISMFTNVYTYIDSIYFFSERNQYIIANSSGMNFEKFVDQNWYTMYKQRINNDPWIIPRKKEERYPFYITLVRPMYINNQEQNGAIIVNINMEEFGKIIRGSRHVTDERIFIINHSGTILYSDQKDEFMLQYDKSTMLANISLEEGSTPVYVKEQEYILSVTNSELFNWTYISLLPVHHYQEKIQSLRTFMIAFAIIGFLVIVLVSFIISARTFAPVKQIMSAFEEPIEEPSEKFNSPELKYILNNISNNKHSKRELENELERRLNLLNKARSVALKSQINPHFLFNTLDTIKWTAIRLIKGNNDVSTMISTLSELMRLSMESDSHLIPISNEIEHAKKYIDIIQYRYGDKVNVHWDIDHELLEYQTVQLSMQPLIENAIYHGIKPTRKKGNIWISLKSIGSTLRIMVRDDGKGMNSLKVAHINEELQGEHDLSGEHIGLQNVNQRIKLIFGNHFGISVLSDEKQGTSISIWFPKVRE